MPVPCPVRQHPNAVFASMTTIFRNHLAASHPASPGRLSINEHPGSPMNCAPSAAGDAAGGGRKKPGRKGGRYDPVARYDDLEAELFRLKFERAQHMEVVQCQELKDRQGRREIERLKGRLGELDLELGGIVMKGAAGSSAPGAALPVEVVVDEGLRFKKEKLESLQALLEKDIVNMRSELDSERDRFTEVSERHDKSESEHYRAESQEKTLKSTGERLTSDQTAVQTECTAASLELLEVREEKDKMEEELSSLREKISLLHAEQTKLWMRLDAARDQARVFRHDASTSKRHSSRVQDQILARNDPKEHRRQRPQRRERRRSERADDTVWAASERQQQAAGGGGPRQHPVMGAVLGRRHSNEGRAAGMAQGGTVYVPHKHSSLRSVLPGARRNSNDGNVDGGGRSHQSMSLRSLLPGMGRRHSIAGAAGTGDNNTLEFLPGSWKKDSSGGNSVISGLTMDTTHRFGQR